MLFCFGLGYCAKALIDLLDRNEWSYLGTSRKKAKNRIFFDGKNGIKNANKLLEFVTHILISIPPEAPLGDPVFFHHQKEISKLRHLKWIGYLSTTGVYGDTAGLMAQETQPTSPTSPRSKRRVDVENNWVTAFKANYLPVHIFRLPGIYGPGRNAFEQLRAGTAKRILKPGHKFSRVHVDDIAMCLKTSMENPKPGSIYNVSDDYPSPPEQVVTFASKLLNIEPPPRIPFEIAKLNMSAMALSFWKDNRTIDNSLVKKELGLKLKYPSFRQGLTAILKNEKQENKK